jgi:type VI secretion system ImpM family protein
VLGSLIQSRVWRWAAVGKHPAAADYIQLEGGTPVLNAMADWMTKGYDHIVRSGGNAKGNYAWRFWLRGVKRGNLIAGVVRDSSDRIGRPFPLLILGEGLFKDWEQQWGVLPIALSKLWQRAEYIGVHPYVDLNALSAEIGSLAAPDTSGLKNAIATPIQETAMAGADFVTYRESLQREGKALIDLNTTETGGPDQASMKWHARLKRQLTEPPRAVFMGGSPQRTCLAVLQQPLSLADFAMLWSV